MKELPERGRQTHRVYGATYVTSEVADGRRDPALTKVARKCHLAKRRSWQSTRPTGGHFGTIQFDRKVVKIANGPSCQIL